MNNSVEHIKLGGFIEKQRCAIERFKPKIFAHVELTNLIILILYLSNHTCPAQLREMSRTVH